MNDIDREANVGLTGLCIHSLQVPWSNTLADTQTRLVKVLPMRGGPEQTLIARLV